MRVYSAVPAAGARPSSADYLSTNIGWPRIITAQPGLSVAAAIKGHGRRQGLAPAALPRVASSIRPGLMFPDLRRASPFKYGRSMVGRGMDV